jgi:hypothetical protein
MENADVNALYMKLNAEYAKNPTLETHNNPTKRE